MLDNTNPDNSFLNVIFLLPRRVRLPMNNPGRQNRPCAARDGIAQTSWQQAFAEVHKIRPAEDTPTV
jgi:hypothetical protein